MSFRAETTCDNGLGEFELITGTGKTETEAIEALGIALHNWMFDANVTEDHESGMAFLEECRDFIVGDPNAATSIAIWTALQDAVRRIQCVEV